MTEPEQPAYVAVPVDLAQTVLNFLGAIPIAAIPPGHSADIFRLFRDGCQPVELNAPPKTPPKGKSI